jgi:hypothetical protein
MSNHAKPPPPMADQHLRCGYRQWPTKADPTFMIKPAPTFMIKPAPTFMIKPARLFATK